MTTLLAPPNTFSPNMGMSSASGSTAMTSSRPNMSMPPRPALPRRLLSLQHTTPQRPSLSPSGMSSIGRPSNPNVPRRPGAPQRSHSFCGDASKSTYALASANACAHLSPDKSQLVAPPLERTLSSIGSKGNQSPPSQQMKRPLPQVTQPDDGVRTPPTPPSSPPEMSRSTLPEIRVLPGSPAKHDREDSPPNERVMRPQRPSLTPYQTYSAIRRDSGSIAHTPVGSPRPKRPSLTPLRVHSGSSIPSVSSRSSSYSFDIATPGTPKQMPLPCLIDEDDMSLDATPKAKSRADVIEEDDMMEVDGMVDRVVELTVRA